MPDFSQVIRREGLCQMYSPDELLLKFQEYVVHMNSTGILWVWELVKYKDHSRLESVPKRAPLSVPGFCVFARISFNSFMSYTNPLSATYSDYGAAAEYITNYCAVDIFNGAAVGVYNGNMSSQMIRKVFKTDEDENSNTNVDKIKHEIAFTNFTDVTELDEHSQGSLPPSFEDINGENVLAKGHERPAETPMDGQPKDGTYDNMENYSSKQMNMEEYNARNGTER